MAHREQHFAPYLANVLKEQKREEPGALEAAVS